jgi:hypothetical protein
VDRGKSNEETSHQAWSERFNRLTAPDFKHHDNRHCPLAEMPTQRAIVVRIRIRQLLGRTFRRLAGSAPLLMRTTAAMLVAFAGCSARRRMVRMRMPRHANDRINRH